MLPELKKKIEETAEGFRLHTPADLPLHSEDEALHTDLWCTNMHLGNPLAIYFSICTH